MQRNPIRIFQHIFIWSIISLSFDIQVFAQTNTDSTAAPIANETATFDDGVNENLIAKDKPTPPTIGLGVGHLTYYGELNDKIITSNAISSLPTFNISFIQPLNDAFDFEIYGYYGGLTSNQRTVESNYNFYSQIYAGGLMINYNFAHLSKKKNRIVEPILGVGVECFEFNSKTDLYDQFGNTYNYWENGSIRNLPENSENASSAIRLSRDYHYETDIRALNQDGFGNYDQFAIAFPVSAGVNLNLAPRWDLRLTAAYKYTLTDYIDGITSEGEGDRKGDAQNDALFHTNVSLRYNFTRNLAYLGTPEERAMLQAIMNEDTDQDGVTDFIDKCLGTPEGAEVDEFGCALDGDEDNVPNYKDQELTSAPNALVDSLGITYTDEDLREIYLRYMDSTGVYTTIKDSSFTATTSNVPVKRKRKVYEKTYAVKLGEFEGAIPSELVNDIISLKDVQTIEKNGTITVVSGAFTNVPDAFDYKAELSGDGFKTGGLVSIDKNGNIRELDSDEAPYNPEVVQNIVESEDIVYRIQLGAFTKAPNAELFANVPQKVEIKSDDGFTRIYSGNFGTYNNAAKAKIDLIQDGFEDAYVVALKSGKKVPLSEAGATLLIEYEEEAPLNTTEKDNMRFRVQIGAYKNQLPTETLEEFMGMENLEAVQGTDGFTRYVAGNYQNYRDAVVLKDQLRQNGFEAAFVIGFFNNEILPAHKALEMIRE